MRMLENPGAVIPPADVYAGPRPSPFNVFATSQCYIFQVDCVELARVLDQYSEEESEQVTTALEKEHKALCDSLKSRRTTVGGDCLWTTARLCTSTQTRMMRRWWR